MTKQGQQPQRSKPRTLKGFLTSLCARLGLSDPLAGWSIKWRMNWMLQPPHAQKITLTAMMLLGAVMLLGGTALGGCATRLVATEVPLPADLTGRCERPDLPEEALDASTLELLGSTQRFSLRQEAAMNVCEAKSMAKDAIIEAHNKAVRKATCPWYRFGLC